MKSTRTSTAMEKSPLSSSSESAVSPDLLSLLAGLYDRLAGEGININLNVNPSDELVLLREQVKQLSSEVARLTSERNRSEYLFRCETLLNQRIQDYCREHDLRIPKQLFTDLKSE